MIQPDDPRIMATLELFDVPAHQHARTADPPASHDAAAQLSTAASHCRAMLEAHASHTARHGLSGLTDEEAGELAGLNTDNDGKRGADLRRLGLIEWVRDDSGAILRRPCRSGRTAGISAITSAGWTALATADCP